MIRLLGVGPSDVDETGTRMDRRYPIHCEGRRVSAIVFQIGRHIGRRFVCWRHSVLR